MAERVWDRFLTEQDKAHLAMTGPRSVGFGERPALLLIDLYRWIYGDEPKPLLEAIEDWPGSCGLAAWDAVPHIQTLLQAARDADIPVIHATGLDGAGIEGWSGRRGGLYAGGDSPEMAERRKRQYDIINEVAPIDGEAVLREVAPIDGEAVLRKSSPSAFWGTPLIGHLNYLGVDTIITGGESTSGCVRASVVDGCTNRYRMIVVEECVFDRHEATHAINLFDMDQKYADVLPLAEVLEWVADWKARGNGGG